MCVAFFGTAQKINGTDGGSESDLGLDALVFVIVLKRNILCVGV